MDYFLIEFLEEPNIVTNEDGNVLYFDDWKTATEVAEQELQNGIVVPLASGIMYVINDAHKAIQQVKSHNGTAVEGSGEESVQSKLGTLLGEE